MYPALSIITVVCRLLALLDEWCKDGTGSGSNNLHFRFFHPTVFPELGCVHTDTSMSPSTDVHVSVKAALLQARLALQN